MDKTDTESRVSGTTEYLIMDWSAIDAALESLPTKAERPPNSFTVGEYAEDHGMSYDGAACRLKKAVKEGLLERTEPVRGTTTYYWVKE